MEFFQTNLNRHPALIAWKKIDAGKVEAKGIETIQKMKKKTKRAVYRIEEIGPSKTSVIAKQSRRLEAIRERSIYEQILPQLPFPAPQFYGFVEETDSEFAWLFLEDVGGETYSPLQKRHRVNAARWMGLMHSSAAQLIDSVYLPDLGTNYYLECLRDAYRLVLNNLSNPALTTDDVGDLNAVLSQCELVESQWGTVERLCKQIPQTLVHSDFKQDNMRVLTSSSGSSILVFDWGNAGWGVPSRDIANLSSPEIRADITIYCKTVQDRWPFLNLEIIQMLADVGEALLCFEYLRWAAMKLPYKFIQKQMSKIKYYRILIDKFIKLTL